MPRTAISTTNVGLGSPLTTLIGYAPYPPNAAQLNWIRLQTYPTQGTPANVSTYAVGSFLFNIQIKSNDASWGYVGFTYPYTFNNFGAGATYIGGTTQAHNNYYSYITIRAYPTYPRTFFGWAINGGTIYSFSNPLNISSSDSIITGGQTLVAIFS